MNQHDTNHALQSLNFLLGNRFTTDDAIRDAHARDASYHRGALLSPLHSQTTTPKSPKSSKSVRNTECR